MLLANLRSALLLSSAALFSGILLLSGCHAGHADRRIAVYDTLVHHDLRGVTVSQDRRAGTITLGGIVGSNDRKQSAEQLAQQVAPGYSILNRIQVQDTGLQSQITAAQADAQLDSAIEKRYRATLTAHLELKHIRYSAYNQTLTLKGSVKTYQQRQEAEDLARKIPQVENVVNEIQIDGDKPKPANS